MTEQTIGTVGDPTADQEFRDNLELAELHPVVEEPKQDEKPKPGDAGYDWSQHYGDAEIYVHTFPDGKVVALKSFASIYNKTWLYKIRKARSDSEVEFAAIERGSCPEAREVLENLDDSAGDPINDLWLAWVKDGTSRGEGDDGLQPGN